MTNGASPAGAALRLAKVSKRFGSTLAVHGVSLSVEGGTFLTILGASGSGKSTTLMLIAGFLQLDGGEIFVDSESVADKQPFERDFGVVFQNYALFPHMTVFENVAFPLKMRRRPASEVSKSVRTALDLVKLEKLDARLPKQLSGGQQQRVALARALVARPRLLLMDEPLSALDKQLREHMQLELKSIQRSLGVTVVYVTHDQAEALVMSDQVAIMKDGRLEQIGPPREIYDRPANRFVAEFIGESNFLPARVTRATDGKFTLQLADGARISVPSDLAVREGEAVTAFIRPERLRIGGPAYEGMQVNGIVESIDYLGESMRVQVRLGGHQSITAKTFRSPAVDALCSGDRVALGWDVADIALLRDG